MSHNQQKKKRVRWLGLIRARKAAGITQERFAELMGTSYETVRKWEAGHRSPKLKKLSDIARVLHCSVADLVA